MNIFIYGDSNTWGYFPTLTLYSGNDLITKRYDEESIWWYSLKEENKLYISGVNGRTCGYDHWDFNGKNGYKTLDEETSNIKHIDLSIIMLGTNDFKFRYNPTIEEVVSNLNKIVEKLIKKYSCKILIICPPYIIQGNPITDLNYRDGSIWITNYEFALKKYCNEHSYLFASAVGCEVGVDGEHLTYSGHKNLGIRVKEVINKI